MRLIRCALAAATVAASASAIGLPLFFTDWMPQSSGATQVRMVNAPGLPRGKGESPQAPFANPGPQERDGRCDNYGGPYCGWVRKYWGGCDREWGLSYGFKHDHLCRHDPRPSPSATSSPSDTSSPSGAPPATESSSSSATHSRLARPKHSAKPSHTATSGPLGHHREQQYLVASPAERPSASSSSNGAHSPVAVDPQLPPSGEDLLGSRPDLPIGVGPSGTGWR